ncbi:MAG: capsular biosynthesis protein [Micropruina sp.]|nr:capsular biosynthesis protein [Micropruina sp.]
MNAGSGVTTVAMTGADGFLGWHTKCALHSVGIETVEVPVGDAFDQDQAVAALAGADRLIHLAGVNRGTDDEVAQGNALFATQIAGALASTDSPPAAISYANSIQADNGSVYGSAKARAADVLAGAAATVGATFADVRLPNLFGEHGRPFYNAVTSTFCHLLATGGNPSVEVDRDLTLLHAQDAAEVLAGLAGEAALVERATTLTVSGLLDRLRIIAATYADGTIPALATPFDRDLVNTYRSYTIDRLPWPLVRHADARGSFFETIKVVAGQGQTSFSTTVPGVTRGDHYHRRKIERFVVLDGRATMRIRRMFTHEVRTFEVTGEAPVAVDMPTMWTHNITNTGDSTLFTQFWISAIYDPTNPDTVLEAV